MPLHRSQTILKENEAEMTISLDVKINYELISEILSHGDEVKVDHPTSLKDIIKKKAENIANSKLL
jgi:predicted DNA-binding transcriptional regulator YafY